MIKILKIMNKQLIFFAFLSVILFSCSKTKFCYECTEKDSTNGAIIEQQSECGLTEKEMDSKMDAFYAKYENVSGSTSCSGYPEE